MDNKKRQKAIVIIITLFFLIMTGSYAGAIIWGIGTDKGTPGLVKVWILVMATLISCTLIVMMIITAVKRHKEIDEEDKNDLSQY